MDDITPNIVTHRLAVAGDGGAARSATETVRMVVVTNSFKADINDGDSGDSGDGGDGDEGDGNGACRDAEDAEDAADAAAAAADDADAAAAEEEAGDLSPARTEGQPSCSSCGCFLGSLEECAFFG